MSYVRSIYVLCLRGSNMLSVLFLVRGIYPTSVSSLRRHHILEGTETWLRYERKGNVNFHYSTSFYEKNFLFTTRKFKHLYKHPGYTYSYNLIMS